MKWLTHAFGWLAVGAGWLVGIVGVVLTATGFFALIGLPLVVVAVVLVTWGIGVTSPTEELVVRTPVRVRPRVLRVVGVRGGCPRGIQLGDTWRIEGAATPMFCGPAMGVVSSLVEGSPELRETSATCRCPLGDYGVRFAVKAA